MRQRLNSLLNLSLCTSIMAFGLGIVSLPSSTYRSGVSVYGAEDEVLASIDEQAIASSVQRAVRFLISNQKPDGAIHDREFATSMTALSIMAMASVGHQPADPTPQGEAMRKALDFILEENPTGRRAAQDSQGYFGRSDGSRMYGHGITTLMLTEMAGMGADAQQDKRIRESLDRAIALILSAQAVRKPQAYQGGWRYEPDANDSDLSVSIWELMALRSAKNDALAVPSTAIDQAVDYLRRSYTSPLDANGAPRDAKAGFSYMPGQNHPTYTMTAAGLLAMQVCGQYDSPLVSGAADWLMENGPDLDERFFTMALTTTLRACINAVASMPRRLRRESARFC